MVTYSDLFTYSLVIIGIIGLFIAADRKKEVIAPAPKHGGYFCNRIGGWPLVIAR